MLIKSHVLNLVQILFIALWVGLIFSLYYSTNIWVDEGITLLQIAGETTDLATDTFVPGTFFSQRMDGISEYLTLSIVLLKTDVHPPLYYLLAETWTRFFGSHPAIIRLLSTVLVGLSAFILLSWNLKTNRNILSLFALPLFLTSPFILFSAGNARDYGLALFLSVLTLYFIHKAMTKSSQKNHNICFFAAITCASLAFLTHYFTILVLLPACLFLIPHFKTVSHKTIFYSILVMIITLLIAYPFLLNQLGAREDQYAGFKGFGTELYGIVTKILQQFNNSQLFVLKLISSVLTLISFLTLVLTAKHNKHAQLHILTIVGFCVLILLLFWATDKTIEGATSRYLVFVIPSFIAGIIIFINIAIKNNKKYLLIPLAVLILGQSYTMIAHKSYQRIAPWHTQKAISAFEEALIINREEKGKIVIPANIWSASVYFSHLNEKDEVYSTYDMQSILQAVQVAAQGTSFILFPAPSWDPALKEIMEEKMTLIKECGFEQKNTFLWTRPSSDTTCNILK
jgi:uncharacterized membrane protein